MSHRRDAVQAATTAIDAMFHADWNLAERALLQALGLVRRCRQEGSR